MTSSPGSMKAINALSMPSTNNLVQGALSNTHIPQNQPSLAPVVMVTSVSGSSFRPQYGEYASAMAFFSLGRPLVGLYWLQSTRSSAAFAAFRMKSGGLYPKKPWPMFTIGCFGDAAAASLMIVL